ncbi:MAG: serine protease [Clostridia bacterium]|nr:serine protease [Clostridia bacterium]
MKAIVRNGRAFIFVILVLLFATLIFSACDDSEEGTLDHDHTFVNKVIEPTCVDKGYDLGVCSICQEEKRSNFVDPKGHTPGEWQVTNEASCVIPKIEEKFCLTCNKSVETRTGEKTEHDFYETDVPPTCRELGYTLKVCSVCNGEEKSDYLPVSSEHTEGEWVITKKATCMDTGYQKKFCTICSKELRGEAIAVSAIHDFSTEYFDKEDGTGGYTKFTCALCGHAKTLDHTSTISPAVIYELISSSMVRIEVYDKNNNRTGIGSGFFVSGDGRIVTNYHVIKASYSVKVTNYAGREFEVAGVMGYDADDDVAMLKVVAEAVPYLEIVGTESLKAGDPVYALGSPLGVDNIFTTGIISNPSLTINGADSIAFTAPISSGNSGGPLVNSEGRVIGINTRTAVQGQNLNFAVRGEKITNLDISNTKTVAEVYEGELQNNAYQILANYIKINKTGTKNNGDVYYIHKHIKDGTDTSYGVEYFFNYDTVSGEITLILNLLTGRAIRYEVGVYITEVSEDYQMYLFDYNMGQVTVEADMKANEKPIMDNLEKIMDITLMKYDNTSDNPTLVDYITKLSYQCYMTLVSELGQLLNASNTGLGLGNFNLVDPEI